MAEETKKKQTVAEMEEEIKLAELELKKLEVLEKKANLQDIQERLAERDLQRTNIRQRAITSGETLKQNTAQQNAAQNRCNHKKGGNGAEGFIAGQGDDDQYAIMKHQFLNGDFWIRCLRCGKTWKPPAKSTFTKDGKLNKEAYDAAWAAYNIALQFPTRNQPSGSYQFRFTSTDPAVDPIDKVREMLEFTTLR